MPAPTASAATTSVEVGFPSRSSPRTSKNLSPSSSCSLRVAMTVPTTFPIIMERRAKCCRFRLSLARAAQRQDQVDIGVRPRNHVHRNQLADAFCAARSGLGGGLYRRDVASHDGSDVSTADLFVPNELDLGRLHHGVRCLHHPDEPFGLD